MLVNFHTCYVPGMQDKVVTGQQPIQQPQSWMTPYSICISCHRPFTDTLVKVCLYAFIFTVFASLFQYFYWCCSSHSETTCDMMCCDWWQVECQRCLGIFCNVCTSHCINDGPAQQLSNVCAACHASAVHWHQSSHAFLLSFIVTMQCLLQNISFRVKFIFSYDTTHLLAVGVENCVLLICTVLLYFIRDYLGELVPER